MPILSNKFEVNEDIPFSLLSAIVPTLDLLGVSPDNSRYDELKNEVYRRLRVTFTSIATNPNRIPEVLHLLNSKPYIDAVTGSVRSKMAENFETFLDPYRVITAYLNAVESFLNLPYNSIIRDNFYSNLFPNDSE